MFTYLLTYASIYLSAVIQPKVLTKALNIHVVSSAVIRRGRRPKRKATRACNSTVPFPSSLTMEQV